MSGEQFIYRNEGKNTETILRKAEESRFLICRIEKGEFGVAGGGKLEEKWQNV